jgi:hypothetical protein
MRGNARWDETWHRLRDWTQGQGPSERLAQQILLAEGFTDLDPSHPLGGKDGGADAIANRDGLRWVMGAYFPRGQQTAKDIEDKLVGDFAGVEKYGANGLAFVTNQELRRAERKALCGAVEGTVEIFHLERLTTILDQPKMYGVREQFLGIAGPDGSLDRDARLEELWRASLARSEARWRSVGLPIREAADLANDLALGSADSSLLPALSNPLVVWTAAMGSGKSIAAERHHQTALETVAADKEAPLPVFLRAADCVPSLQAAVQAAAAEVGEVRQLGASVVVDGVDEVGYQAAGELLTQARVLAGTWPNTTVLLTSRGVPVLTEAVEHKRFPPLDEDAQEDCVRIGAGVRGVTTGGLYSLPQPVRAVIAQPFFALLVGLWMRERGTVPRAQIDLMAMLGERATRDLSIDESHLRTLAVKSVACGLGPVPSGDVLDGMRADELLSTGLVERRGAGLAFVLPAVAQWFAAQALLLDELDGERLLDAPEDLELWLYPLALAISLGSADRAGRLLAPFLHGEAGFAMRILDTIFGQAVLGGAKPPLWREGGVQARECVQALADALGPLAGLVAEVDHAGRVLPMAVASNDVHLTVSFWRGEESRPDVFQLSSDVHFFQARPGWGMTRSSQVGPGAAWAWHWAHSDVNHQLDQVLKNAALPVDPSGPLGYEAAWAAACDLTEASPLTTDRIAITAIEALLEHVSAEVWDSPGPVIFQRLNRGYDVRGLRAVAATAREQGADDLLAPLPVADQPPVSGGYIGEFYSDERLLEIARQLYANAFLGYRELVERWMPTLASQLEHYVLMPMRLVGFIYNDRDGQGHALGPIPHGAGYIEALPEGVDSTVSVQTGYGNYDFAVGEHSYQQQRSARPQAARWLTGTHGGIAFEVGKHYPVSRVVYKWLAQDLKRIGLVGGLAWSRQESSVVPFDMPGLAHPSNLRRPPDLLIL